MRGLVFIAGLLGAGFAHANVIGNDSQNFNPTTSGLDFVTVQSSETLEPGILNFGFFLNRATNVLPETLGAAGNRIGSKDALFASDLNFGYGVAPRTDLGLNFSSLLQQTTDRNDPGAQFSKSGLNEVRANLKFRFLERSPVGLALIASGNFNQVKNNPFLGRDPGPTWNLELAADASYHENLFALNIGYRDRRSGEPLPGALYQPLSDQVIASLAWSRYFPTMDFKLIFETFAARAFSAEVEENGEQESAEWMLGGKYDLSPKSALHAGAGSTVVHGLFSPDLRVYVGVNYSWELYRPSAPPPPAPVVNVMAAPQITVYKGFTPEHVDELSEVPFDEIARTHEFTMRTSVDQAMAANERPPFELVRLDGLEFAFGSSVIPASQFENLQHLVSYLNSHPKVLKIRVEGHTDSLGSEERNQTRSDSRAGEVLRFLKEKGLNSEIAATSIGYGSARPIADNGNFQGRQKNRRVEIRILRKIPSFP